MIDCQGPGAAVPSVNEDESVHTRRLRRVRRGCRPPRWSARIRGLETLLQLVTGDAEGFFIPGVQIQDRPRFPWRGLLIDAGRHFEPVEVIKRELDAHGRRQAQRPPLAPERGPGLPRREPQVTRSSTSSGRTGTTTRRISFATSSRTRGCAGIRVVPEFDMPGPRDELGRRLSGARERARAVHDRARVRRLRRGLRSHAPRRLTSSSTTSSARSRRSSPTRTGTSAVTKTTASSGRPTRRSRSSCKKHGIKDSAGAADRTSTSGCIGILRKHGKRMMGWDEILEPGLPKEAVDPLVARPALARRRGEAGLRRRAVCRLLHRPDEHGRHALRRRSAAGVERSDARGGRARTRRRGDDVGRMGRAGDDRLADLAAHGRDRRALLVAARHRGRRRYVPPAGRGQRAARGARHRAFAQRRRVAATLDVRRRIPRRSACSPTSSSR